MEKTLALARKFNAIEIIPFNENYFCKKNNRYKFLIVLDFESTCWNTKTNLPTEIIEFSTVLINLENNNFESEFTQYCIPMITQKLSEFCIELTGITQEKVDNGVPLKTCLMLFNRWIKECSNKFEVKIETTPKNTLFVTWTDWDLNICLHNECKRKAIMKPNIFNEWMDLKYKFKELYKIYPKGLRGALEMKGMEFEGREHCGLDDAKNTALLALKMIAEGMVVEATRNKDN